MRLVVISRGGWWMIQAFVLSLLFSVSFTYASAPALPWSPGPLDVYSSFFELSAVERAGVDFRIFSAAREPRSFLVLAIHGGGIEFATSEIASAIAGADKSLYLFEGLKPVQGENRRLHITSHHFDEPRALELAASHELCVSIHGFPESIADRICPGGRNKPVISAVLAALSRAAPWIELGGDCGTLHGRHPRNIVNRCKNAGVQLEFSLALRQRMTEDRALFDSLVNAISTGAGEGARTLDLKLGKQNNRSAITPSQPNAMQQKLTVAADKYYIL